MVKLRFNSEAEICKEALAVQDACNASGVVHTFGDVMSFLISEMIEGKLSGTTAVNRHPVVLLFLDKLNDLSGRPSFGEISEAYDYCAERRKDNGKAGEDKREGNAPSGDMAP